MADRAEASYKNKEDRMKKLLSLSVTVLLLTSLAVSGCSKDESKETASERVEKDIASRMKAPVEEAQSVTDKVGKMRAAENNLPE